MQNLMITAVLSKPVVPIDKWSPTLDGLLTWQILKNEELLITNPSKLEIFKTINLVKNKIPLEIGELDCAGKKEWYFKASSPSYKVKKEDQEIYLSQTYNTINIEYVTSRINWFCVGDITGLQDLLQTVLYVGKKNDAYRTRIVEWVVKPFNEDWHLWRGDRLAKPVPCSAIVDDKRLLLDTYEVKNWRWRPLKLDDNKAKCVMPARNIL